ncbi:hypothetical protein M5K25_001353 [Dendrobium thyrsiflorum]|uniref:Pseudouridine synthase RsuA/RluA-like domain-containing protein n=1 Tax=Dendrobium thyrsiflorum TaxID=117978 RepID=A0ABD0VQ39_DENTH
MKLLFLISNQPSCIIVTQVWNYACERTMQRYWALVIGSPQEKQGVISAPLSKKAENLDSFFFLLKKAENLDSFFFLLKKAENLVPCKFSFGPNVQSEFKFIYVRSNSCPNSLSLKSTVIQINKFKSLAFALNFGSLPASPPFRGNFRSHSLPATTRKLCTVGVGGHRGRSLRLRHANRGVHGPSRVLLNDGKTERVMLAHPSGFDGFQEAITEYRVLGPTINGCSWLELRPLTGRKHQLRVHCAEALGTPIVGDYKYGWFVHKRWKQMPRPDYEPFTGAPYKLRRPEGFAVQKGSVLSKVPLLHLHCRELVIPNIAKFLGNSNEWFDEGKPWSSSKPDVLRFVAPMPSHMKISWNCMSSFLV